MDTISKKSGIYVLRNTYNDDIYIGSTNNLKVRINSHFSRLKIGKHENAKLQNVYNKYGEVFEAYIIEECSIEILLEREQYYIDTYKPYYNISPSVNSTTGYKHTEESKEKMSISKKELYINGFKVWNVGISPTQEVKEKISNSLKGRFEGENHPFYGKKHTEEAKKIMLEASLKRIGKHYDGKKGRVFKLDKDTLEVLDVYSSAPAAAETLNIKGKVETAGNKIGEAVKHNRNAYGFKWCFEKDLDQLKLDELLETLSKKSRAISSQASDTSDEGSETTGGI